MSVGRRVTSAVWDHVRGLALLEVGAQALLAERLVERRGLVEQELARLPWWRWIRRRRLEQTRALLALLVQAYVKGIKDAPKAAAAMRRGLILSPTSPIARRN